MPCFGKNTNIKMAKGYISKYELKLVKNSIERIKERLSKRVKYCEFKTQLDRIPKMSSFNIRIKNLQKRTDRLLMENRLLKNEIKAINKRHDNLKELFRQFIKSKKVKELERLLEEM